ncbi:hypothetical protein C8J57DRAFT_1533753 [Mycena rebaudengoi]|nr:hypothetical protein C8J57DRAFT_1533753 [Mycena rebaudengoi]
MSILGLELEVSPVLDVFSATARYEDAVLAPRRRVAPGEVFIRFVSVSQTSRFDHLLIDSPTPPGALVVTACLRRPRRFLLDFSRSRDRSSFLPPRRQRAFPNDFGVPVIRSTTSTMLRVMALSLLAFPRCRPRLFIAIFRALGTIPTPPARTAPPSRFLIPFLVFLAPFPSSSVAALATFFANARAARSAALAFYIRFLAPREAFPAPLSLGGAKNHSPRAVPSSRPFFCILQVPAMRGQALRIDLSLSCHQTGALRRPRIPYSIFGIPVVAFARRQRAAPLKRFHIPQWPHPSRLCTFNVFLRAPPYPRSATPLTLIQTLPTTFSLRAAAFGFFFRLLASPRSGSFHSPCVRGAERRSIAPSSSPPSSGRVLLPPTSHSRLLCAAMPWRRAPPLSRVRVRALLCDVPKRAFFFFFRRPAAAPLRFDVLTVGRRAVPLNRVLSCLPPCAATLNAYFYSIFRCPVAGSSASQWFGDRLFASGPPRSCATLPTRLRCPAPPSFFFKKIDISRPRGRLLCVSMPWRRTAPFIGVRLSALLRDVLNAPLSFFKKYRYLASPRPASLRLDGFAARSAVHSRPSPRVPTRRHQRACDASRPPSNTARGLLHSSDATRQTPQVTHFSLVFPVP